MSMMNQELVGKTMELEFNPYELELEQPVKFGKEYIEKLALREPTSRELRGLKLGGEMTFGDILDIAQKLTEQPRRVIDSLSKKDAMALVERVGFLLEDGI